MIRVVLPGPLQGDAGGRARVEVRQAAPTVGEALEALFGLHPRLRPRILDEQGRVRPHVNVFVDRESIRLSGGLATRLLDGAEIMVLPAVSGG